MKIEAITLREIQMPLVHFFETSFSRLYSRRTKRCPRAHTKTRGQCTPHAVAIGVGRGGCSTRTEKELVSL